MQFFPELAQKQLIAIRDNRPGQSKLTIPSTVEELGDVLSSSDVNDSIRSDPIRSTHFRFDSRADSNRFRSVSFGKSTKVSFERRSIGELGDSRFRIGFRFLWLPFLCSKPYFLRDKVLKRATAHSSLTMTTPISRCSEVGPEESVSQGFTDPNEINFHKYDEEEEDWAIYSIPDTHETTSSILALMLHRISDLYRFDPIRSPILIFQDRIESENYEIG